MPGLAIKAVGESKETWALGKIFGIRIIRGEPLETVEQPEAGNALGFDRI
jgi:hypothetical protein